MNVSPAFQISLAQQISPALHIEPVEIEHILIVLLGTDRLFFRRELGRECQFFQIKMLTCQLKIQVCQLTDISKIDQEGKRVRRKNVYPFHTSAVDRILLDLPTEEKNWQESPHSI